MAGCIKLLYWFIVIFNIALLGSCLLLIIVLAPVFLTMVVYLRSNNTALTQIFKIDKYTFILIVLITQLLLFLMLITLGIFNPVALDYFTYLQEFSKYAIIRINPYAAISQFIAFISVLIFMVSTFFRVWHVIKKERTAKLLIIGVLTITWVLIRSIAALVMIYTLTGSILIPKILFAPLLHPSIILAVYILTAVIPLQAGLLFRNLSKNKKVHKNGVLLVILGAILSTLVFITLFMGGVPVDPRLSELINICVGINKKRVLQIFKVKPRHFLGLLEFLRIFDKYKIIKIFPITYDDEILRLWKEMGFKYAIIWFWVWFDSAISVFGTLSEHIIMDILYKFTIVFTAVIFSLIIIKKFNLIDIIRDLFRNIF